jgi:predicted RNA-binding Zn-ribbon protein involved in translation (DUF1610 family)
MGTASYQASAAEISLEVRRLLEEHGPLENLYLIPLSKIQGKRVKASALFEDEADAKLACSLNNKAMGILGNGKLTVTLLHTAKIKVPNTVYHCWKSCIDERSRTWKEQHLSFHIYEDAVCTTIKVEGDSAEHIANARKIFKEISTGTVLKDGDNAIWAPALGSNGSAYQKLKAIEKELQVAIQRIRSKRHLLYYGPPEKLHCAVHRITDMLNVEAISSYELKLMPRQFSWMIRGGHKSIEREVGRSVAVLDIVSKRLNFSGTQQQYERILAMMDGNHIVDIQPPTDTASAPFGTCPICFCEADHAIRTSCNHAYCLECFEDYCRSTADTSKEEFKIKCQADGGICRSVFTLRELKELLSSSVFEAVLESSFDEYVQRHPEAFHHCPSPDCGFIYRCTAMGRQPSTYTCPKCLAAICTSCHVGHEQFTCAEYKDFASGGFEASQQLKKKLNIKDCPKCTTPMEKTMGCNHMICGGCKAHICWVCLAVFDASGPCYAHMREKHGGIGLEQYAVADDVYAWE